MLDFSLDIIGIRSVIIRLLSGTKFDEQKSEKQHKRIVLDIFIKNLATIDRVLVSKAGQLTFRFKDGTEICNS